MKDNADGLRAYAANWIRIYPEALNILEGDCQGDSTMKGPISAWRSQHPRDVSQRKERDSGPRSRLFSEDPEGDRRQRGFVSHLKEPYKEWDVIELAKAPDDPEAQPLDPEHLNVVVKGSKKFAIAGWLNVPLPSLNEEHPDKERHILVRESDYPEAGKRFSQVTEGRNRTFKSPQTRACCGTRRDLNSRL